MRSPTARERKALGNLAHVEWEYEAQLYVGEKTILALVFENWIEYLPTTPTGIKRCRITESGKVAFAMPKISPLESKIKLKVAPSGLSVLPKR